MINDEIQFNGWVLLILAVPTTVLVMVALFRGYNIHFTKHRIVEKDKDKDDKDEEE